MKRKKFLPLLLFLIAAAMVWLLLRAKVPITAGNAETNHLPQATSSEPINPKPNVEVANAPTTNPPTNNSPAVAVGVNPDYIKFYEEETAKDRNFDWKRPINFWGRVVDESNEPVAGANAHFNWTDLSENRSSEADAKSDGYGFFSLVNRTGKRMSVKVSKDGYYTPKGEFMSFEYANPYDGLFVPDQNNPIVFHLRKKGEGESLISRETFYGLKPDGTPQYLDLRTGNKTTGGAPTGDLMMQLTRTVTDNPQRFDWKFILQGINDAGLIESQDEFMFEAPENDYENTIQQEGRADDYPYRNETHKNYYVRLADGKTYARIETDLYVKYNKEAAVDIILNLNPTGSRNLEPK